MFHCNAIARPGSITYVEQAAFDLRRVRYCEKISGKLSDAGPKAMPPPIGRVSFLSENSRDECTLVVQATSSHCAFFSICSRLINVKPVAGTQQEKHTSSLLF